MPTGTDRTLDVRPFGRIVEALETLPEDGTLTLVNSFEPEPLKLTLERLTELDEGTVLVQVNDRTPQHPYPRLEERGYGYTVGRNYLCIVASTGRRRRTGAYDRQYTTPSRPTTAW